MRLALPLLVLLIASCDLKPRPPAPVSASVPVVKRPEGDLLALTLRVIGEARVGKPVVFGLQVKNVSKQEVQAVRCVDGSDTNLRYPIFEAVIEGPGGRLFSFLGSDQCGHQNELRKEDFVSLKPGEQFDPWIGPGFGGHRLQEWKPPEAGRYRLTFAIDYAGKDPEQWNSSLERTPADVAALAAKVSGWLSHVPVQRLEAEIDFDVAP